jgi:hypothetical protein
MFLARVGEGFGRPIAQPIQWIPGLFEFLHDFNCAINRIAKRFHPVIVKCLDEM